MASRVGASLTYATGYEMVEEYEEKAVSCCRLGLG